MDRTAAAALVLVILVVLLGLMWLGWRNLRRRSAGIPAPLALPAESGAERYRTAGLHVATTHAGRPLDRVAVRGLAFRANADIRVTSGGVELRLAGGAECFVPAASVQGVERSSWTIDRAVERDGLVVLRWTLGETPVDTNLRVEDPAALAASLSTLLEVPEGRKPA
ncbi:hypothetical protein ACFFGH_31320 [Lysobacter korlensis]|uniref:PH domain-containing protein n=1 Tax=Lysobacter korlensis TaxID=553636 RepID=A0ABV6S2L2_9GAMM